MSEILLAALYSLPGCALAYWFGYRAGKADTVFEYELRLQKNHAEGMQSVHRLLRHYRSLTPND